MSVEHGDKGWIQKTSLTWQRLVLRSSTIGEMIIELLQQGLVVLQVTRTGMEAQDTHEDILVVG